MPPVDAAKVAAAERIRIYTIAVGDPASAGEEALDLDTLNRVSEVTGGRAFEALDQAQMREAYATIGELEPELYDTTSFRPRQSIHWLPVALFVSLYLLYHGINALLALRHRNAADAA